MFPTKSILIFAFVLAGLVQSTSGQDIPYNELPPIAMMLNQKKNSAISLRWRIEQAEFSKHDTRRRLAELEAREARLADSIEALSLEIPAEIRLIDESVRAQLIGRALGELLDAELELATQTARIGILEQKLERTPHDEFAKLREQEHQQLVASLGMRIKAAEAEFAHLSKLAEKGYVTEQQVEGAKIILMNSVGELDSAMLRHEISVAKIDAESANYLADARVELKPIEARIIAVKEFLKSFDKSAAAIAKIGVQKREVDLIRASRLQLKAEEIRLETSNSQMMFRLSKFEDAIAKEKAKRAKRNETLFEADAIAKAKAKHAKLTEALFEAVENAKANEKAKSGTTDK